MPLRPRARRSTQAKFRSRVEEGRRRALRCQRHTTSLPCCAARDVRGLRESESRAASAGRTILQFARSGAWLFLSAFDLDKFRARSRRRQFSCLDRDDAVPDFVRIFEQAALRWTRGPRAVTVVSAAMAGAHEEPGLWKPANRTAQMGAVDGEDLELVACNSPYPTSCIRRLAVGRPHVGVPECGQPCLALREFANEAERHPGKVALCAPACDRRQKVFSNWHGEGRGDTSIEKNSQLHEESASGERRFD